jgi:hypothetical protein
MRDVPEEKIKNLKGVSNTGGILDTLRMKESYVDEGYGYLNVGLELSINTVG